MGPGLPLAGINLNTTEEDTTMALLRKNMFDYDKKLIGYQIYDTDTSKTIVYMDVSTPTIKTDIDRTKPAANTEAWSPNLSIMEASDFMGRTAGMIQ